MSDETKAAPARTYTDDELAGMACAPPEADMYGFRGGYDLCRRWERLRGEAETRVEKAKLKLMQADDEAAKTEARSFKPDVSVKRFVAGDFLCVGEHEIPRRYIEAISVVSTGSEPRMSVNFAFHGGVRAHSAQPGVISIQLASGKAYTISCSRHSIDAMSEAVTNAWKHGEAV